MSTDWKLLAVLNGFDATCRDMEKSTLWSLGENRFQRNYSVTGNELVLDYSYSVSGLPGSRKLELNLPLAVYSADFLLPLLKNGNSVDLTQRIVVCIGGMRVEIDPSGSDGRWQLIRSNDANSYRGACRLRFSAECPESGAAGKARLVFRLLDRGIPLNRILGDSFIAGDFSQAATRPIKDDEKRGGWMGQGGFNDLRNLPQGQISVCGIPFLLNERVVVLRSENTPDFPLSSDGIRFDRPENFTQLYFLQTAAWGGMAGNPEVARYRLHYEDGTVADFPIRCGRDIDDWWVVRDLPNAKQALQLKTAEGRCVGIFLYRLNNPNPEKKLSAIEMISSNIRCAPALLAVTGIRTTMPGALAAFLEEKWTARKEFRPGANWPVCEIAWRDTIEENSALDVSFLNHCPAGKFGFLQRHGDHFEFENAPGEAVRFWGTNLAIMGPYPPKDLAPGLASCFARQGVNLVRIHLYACRPDQLCASDGTLDEKNLDKLFFLISELKKNGIYIYLDLNDGIQYDRMLRRTSTYWNEERLKYASLFDSRLQQAVHRLAELLLTRVNPYTGLTLADDPVLAMVELINELSMVQNWEPIPGKLADKKIYLTELEALWKAYLNRNKLPARPLPPDFVVDAEAARFGYEIDRSYHCGFQNFLRKLGVRVPMTGLNLGFGLPALKAAEGLDFYGDHNYFNHPDFASRPMRFRNVGALESPITEHPAGYKLFRSCIGGYPVVHSEWNYCFPASTRSEGFPIIAATGAYQNWSGLIFYCATGSCDDGQWERFLENPAIMVHSQQTDPSTWGLSQFAALLYRRGDVTPAVRTFELVVPSKDVFSSQISLADVSFLGLMGKLCMRFSDTQPANELVRMIRTTPNPLERFRIMVANDFQPNGNCVVSDTGELRRYIHPAVFVVDTPSSQSVSGKLAEFQQIKDFPRSLHFDATLNYGSIALTALDGKAIPESRRLLLTVVGNSANTGEFLADSQILDMGKAPVLTEPVRAALSIASASAAKVFALTPSTGKRKREIPVDFHDGKLRFFLNGDEGTIYYEIIKYTR